MNTIHLPLTMILLTIVPTSSNAGEAEQVLFEDSFDGRLGPGWSWVREDPQAWRVEKGMLVMRTSAGGLWQKHNNSRNILLRSLPAPGKGLICVEVQVENEPTNAFEHAGLVWYRDDDNYAILVRERVDKKPIVQLVSETKGRPRVGFAEQPYENKTVWLRMEMSRARIRGKFRSSPEKKWQLLGECELPAMEEARVGLLTGYAPKTPEHWVQFKNFRIIRAAK